MSNVNGVLIRGKKGLYFISEKDMERYKVPAEQEAPALKILDKEGTLKAPRASGKLQSLQAIEGALGERVGKLDWNLAAINPTIPGKILVANLASKG